MQVRFVYPLHRPRLIWPSVGESQPLVAHVQQLLAEYGFYRGPIHGCFDAATTAAVCHFQEFRGLKPTGCIDPVTYCLLLPSASTSEVEPSTASRAKIGQVRTNIVISKSVRRLTVLQGNSRLRDYPVALGKPSTPTPEGNYAIATKIFNPGGVLGTRWMGLNFDAYGIHGTNAPWKIGQLVSNGCIRMHNAHAEELYQLVNVGTPVLIRN